MKLHDHEVTDADLLVLVALDDGEVWPGFLDDDTWRYSGAEPIESAKVTHWMDLPEHPTEVSR